jgi:hypothetical protein
MLQDGIRVSSVQQGLYSRGGYISRYRLNCTSPNLVATSNSLHCPGSANRFVTHWVKTLDKSISQKRTSICRQSKHRLGQCLDWN